MQKPSYIFVTHTFTGAIYKHLFAFFDFVDCWKDELRMKRAVWIILFKPSCLLTHGNGLLKRPKFFRIIIRLSFFKLLHLIPIHNEQSGFCFMLRPIQVCGVLK